MTNDNLLQLFDWLKNGTPESYSIHEIASQICIRHGFKTPYEIQFKPLMDDLYLYDIVLSPGNIVLITINDRYILECITERRSPYYFRHRLEQALERLPRMHRVLRHPIPLTTSIALKKEARQFIKIPTPNFGSDYILASKYFKTIFTVTVEESLTGTSIKMSGDDPKRLELEAKRRLSQMIYDKEDLLDMMDEINRIANHKPEHNPQIIGIGGEDGEIREDRKY